MSDNSRERNGGDRSFDYQGETLASKRPAPSPTPSVSTEPPAPIVMGTSVLIPLNRYNEFVEFESGRSIKSLSLFAADIEDTLHAIASIVGIKDRLDPAIIEAVRKLAAPSVAGTQPTPEERELLLAQFFPQGTPQVEEIASQLLDAMETCHICHSYLILPEFPVHCEDCSSDCENHDGGECTPIYVLHERLRKALQTRKHGVGAPAQPGPEDKR